MFRFNFLYLIASVFLSVSLIATSSSHATETVVRFDVPSLLGVQELEIEQPTGIANSQKLIEVVIPVTTEIRAEDRNNIKEFRFDVYWNRNVYPIFDYGPKTQASSSIEGLISVDRTSQRNAKVGLNAGSGYQDIVDGSLKADLGTSSSLRTSYQEIPQHEVLVASGTIKRGTGAFFRFHPSRTEILEGGRDLVVAFQVPQNWRGGVLQIECRANGYRKVLGAWKDEFEVGRAFVLPIYLEGDDQARTAAVEFARSEQKLRRQWDRHQKSTAEKKHIHIGALIGGEFPFAGAKSSPKIPQDWIHYLIQSGDAYLDYYEDRLPVDVADAAGHFVQARTDLLKLGR